jgi:hypothetical protein
VCCLLGGVRGKCVNSKPEQNESRAGAGYACCNSAARLMQLLLCSNQMQSLHAPPGCAPTHPPGLQVVLNHGCAVGGVLLEVKGHHRAGQLAGTAGQEESK